MRFPTLLVSCALVLPSCNRNGTTTAGQPASKGDEPVAAEKAEPEPEQAPEPEPEPELPEPPEPLALPAELDEPELADDGPKIVVQLPPAPAFEDTRQVDKYEAGEWSVAGLRKDIDARVQEGNAGKEVEVRAYVQEIYLPPACPPGDVCPPPKQPHVWVVDDPDEAGKRKALLVVNYAFSIPEWEAKRWQGEPDVVLEVGKQYKLKGKFKRFSDTGFAHDRGLLEFSAVWDDTGGQWIYPPGAPWHPVEVQRVEEANQALFDKARKEAKKP